ncbi:MAG TPA: chloride channel protein [Terriglobales bacterium]|jgi:chloride channel protein, CIC family|nr:chloride channel protein [Terriglobales bacterium]
MQDSNPPSTRITGAPPADAKTQFAVTGINTAAEQQPLATAPFRLVMISLLAAVIGLLAGGIAFLLYKLIGLFTNIAFYGRFSAVFLSARHNHLGLWVIPIPVIGGLIVGVMAKYGSSKIKGHGIPEAMEAVLVNRSRIEPRVAILKPISAAIAIGTGGPFGAEGPIIQTGGAVGSLIGQVLHTTASERKVLLACGAAAGMSATFNTPIAGVILAIELLLFEFKSRSFIPLVIASTLATAVHMQLLGAGPMFRVAEMNFDVPTGLPFYLLLGGLCGLAAVGFTRLLYWTEDLFEKLPIDELWWPAIGALGLGIIGYFVPRVLGVGYDTIGDILNGTLVLKMLIVVMLAKSVALVVSLGSGTSGGLLAPMFMSSAAMGGAFAMVLNKIIPSAHLSPGAFALVAMGAVFGAASRATFSFIIFAFEITRDYNSVLPLMLVSVIADGIAMLLMPSASIMTEKLRRRGLRIPHEYEADVLYHMTVSQTMDHDVPSIPAAMKIGDLAERIARGEPQVTGHHAMIVLDQQGKLAGVITRGDIMRALDKDPSGGITVHDAGSQNVVVTYPDEGLQDASEKMLRHNIGRLPVVDRNDEKNVVGYLGRPGIMAARLHRFNDEYVREAGWFKGFHKRTS